MQPTKIHPMAMSYWSDLPPELLDLVANLFDTPSDTRHFRSVCSSWRSAVPRPLSLVFPPIKFLSRHLHHCDLRLVKHSFFHLSLSSDRRSPGWLIKTEERQQETATPTLSEIPSSLSQTESEEVSMNAALSITKESNPNNSFLLFNPFSRAPIKTTNYPKKLDLTNLKVRELGHEYVLRNINDDNMGLHNMEHEKVAIVTYFSNNSHVSEYVILSTHNTGKLLMYRSINQEWSFLDDFTLGYDDRSIFVNDWSLHYVDVVEYHGTFYAVTNSGRTVAINVGPHDSSVTVTLLMKSIIGGDKKCLVKSADDLLLVDLYTCPTPGLVKVHAVEIFKLDKEEQKWGLVESLGDRTLFLSNHSSFSAIGLPGCKRNCIYFQFKNLDKDICCEIKEEDDNNNNVDDFRWKNDEVGVFDFEKGIVGSLDEYLEDSKLFSWPPPDWVRI